MSIGQTIRNFKRLNQIANLMAKQEMGYFLEKLNLTKYLAIRKREKTGKFIKRANSMPERLRFIMEELGGTFVKLGQLLSLRHDLIPPEYSEEFEKLQDSVKPFSFLAVKKTVESEYGKSLRSVFRKFDKDPIASASVGQVHKAVLKNGDIVAVKVQRPNIGSTFETDIQLMYHLARILEEHMPELKRYDPVGIVREFESYTRKELDYMLEAKNIDVFYQNFKRYPKVRIPKVYWEHTTSKVLVMEYIDGIKISEVKNFSKYKSSRKQIAHNLANAFLKQVLDDGYFHADPHPGNIFLLKNNRIALLDFGIVGKLTPEDMEKIEDLFIALIEPNVDGIVRCFIDYGFVDEDEIDIRKFRSDLIIALEDYYGSSLKQIDMVGFAHDIFKIARQYKVKFPVNFVLLLKAMATLEGMAQKLYPDFSFTEFSRPKIEKIIQERLEPAQIFKNMRHTFEDWKYNMKKFPKDISDGLRAFRKGLKVNLDIDNTDIKRFTIEVDRSSNRISLSMVMASLILAAAVIMHAQLQPLVWGYPLLAVVCIFIAVFLLLMLLVSILRERAP